MQYRKLKELKKLEGNPRIIKDKQFKTLCESIENNPKYFEARPCILSNRTGEFVIIAGNQRYEAAKFLKMKEVPTFLMEGLTEEKEREIVIRDNISNGEFDYDALANAWSDLPLADWGVDLPEDWLGDSDALAVKEESERYKIIFDFDKDDASFVQTILHQQLTKNKEDMDDHWRERCLLRLLKKLK